MGELIEQRPQNTTSASEGQTAEGAGEACNEGPAQAAATVWYDGGCPVCSREIALYKALPGSETIDWVDLTTAPEAALPQGHDRQSLMARFTVRRRDGRIADGAAGFLALWHGLPRFARLATILDRQPFRALAEAGYRLFLAARPLWRRS
ncbi:MAG: DUF393 domain-containing protein [Pseudomonadota bacterium]